MRIDFFTNEYRFLSNFYAVPVLYEGVTYPTSEHAFQAAKTFDADERLRISKLDSPRDAKYAGRHVILRPAWEHVKVDVMTDIVRAKFTQNPEMKQKLIATGDAELIEGNHWGDVEWGVCNGKGHNKLGKILMDVREELKAV